VGTEIGSWAACAILLSHSLISPLLFCFANIVYESIHSRSYLLGFTSGLSPSHHLVLALLLGINFGLPPSLGFWSELMIFFAIGTAWSTSLSLLAITSLFCFLYCVFYYVLLVSGPSSPIFVTGSGYWPYIPPTFLCILCPLSSSLFSIT